MQAKFLSAIIVIAASLGVSAAPAGEGAVNFCPETNWGGGCENLVLELGQCQEINDVLPGGIIGSIGPGDQIFCYGYKQQQCAGDVTWIWTQPGEADGGVSSGVPWKGNLQSLLCYTTKYTGGWPV
ncbi:hypothetical protein BDN72DRAFT_838418 [Pluteus cervinus]|uniref:Uncharacterized protein n=1 Tax=Pluteus cervinus TaxID=181527 RepID=A0ACD3AZ45_9AGAR|nr:hypothetical protein BDN72DRAFT_838418 [Pluteus cervinus]